jgi:hypothetical protein
MQIQKQKFYPIPGEAIPRNTTAQCTFHLFFGASRYHSSQAWNLYSSLCNYDWEASAKFWIAQANHIFDLLRNSLRLRELWCEFTKRNHIFSKRSEIVWIHWVGFVLKCLPNPCCSQGFYPEGYLFVCPPENFRTGQSSFQWPENPAFWSLDPRGADPLSSEDAKTLGFPILHIETIVVGYTWKGSDYEGLRRFHQGKGFNPESQDAARALSYPLIELSGVEIAPSECAECKLI